MTQPATAHTANIEPLVAPVSDTDFRALAELLVDAVDSGAAVSFLAPLSVDHAEAWWRNTIATAHAKAVFLVARDADRAIIGTVQMHPAWAPNQPHRADIAKVLVHRRARRLGLGRQLMAAIEAAALRAGFTLLTLDAKRGGAAEQMYRQLGWVYVGSIPRFALDTDGVTPHDDVIFYKTLQ
jgi:GNAT superfamily N-acetyltransferase